ncbi:lipase ZK262.3-like [Mercenaria mercenaria]|uniref:lipase ZK262.3-like n=1 Tax=Mercenaria mercenaria TaxID=6596 RepID=UPI00234F938A|nr:lipase ZK262.3-like [Mercenaria mercenaria]
MSKTCHAPGSGHNSCMKCTNSDISKLCSVKEAEKCNRDNLNNGKSGEFEPYDAFNAARYSAVAYTDHPTDCADKILPGLPEVVEVIGRRCNYLIKYEECFAFTAVSHPLKKIILAYRGTASPLQLIEQIVTIVKLKVPAKGGGNVQEYFSNANDQIYPCAKSSIKDLVNKYPNYRVVVTGHSLGGAIASIASAHLSFDNVIDKDKTTLYTFGMPRTGDRSYAKNHDRLVPKSWRIVHFRDIVAQLPPMTLSSFSPYHHQREIFYGKDMSVISDYIECFKYEDPECKNSVSPSISSIDYHIIYYGIPVGSHCDDKMSRRRKRSDADSDMSHLFSNDTCKRIRVADLPTSGAVIYVHTVMSITYVLIFHVAFRPVQC